VQAERFLCERDSSGQAVLDSGGNPILECMCGNVIRCRFDPSQPFFTERGSFWTNSTTELPATTTEKDRLARTRNRCNGEGYESVALIPLRSGDEVIGLLQLNDRRRGMFTLEKIKFFEEMSAGIGIAVARKRAAAAMENSLREKEALIKEIHHRVKNNMQVISSMLNLQATATNNEECRGILKGARTRIRAMSLVHEKLYQSQNLVNIDLGEYIQNLADHLFHAYQVKPDQIRLEMEFEKVPLDINSSVPCGLLLNELISNALKHAFPKYRKGVLKIGLRRGVENRVELRVADDGVGFPEGFDFRKADTLGLQIVNLLMGQLEATIELDRKNGTAFTVTFRELSYKPRL
jgi:two-component sensor histidine kinase